MKRLGKRFGMLIGLGLLALTVPVWAQSPAPAAARQAEDAAARAQLEAAQARVKAAEAARPAAAVRQGQPVPTPAPLPGKATIVSPYTQIEGYYTELGNGLNIKWNTTNSKDPLAALQVAPGTWWNNADTASRLALTKEQQRKMDDIFQQFRLTLIDLNASLSKEELILDPLIAAEKLDEVKVLAQIDRIAQARAELEKANSRMLLGIRQSLTMEQWTKIQASPATYRILNRR